MIFIYSVFPNKKEAKRIGQELIKKRLAGCVNLFPIESVYRWKKRVVKDKEVVTIIKTQKKNFKKIKEFILKNHSYDIPCILEIPVKKVAKKYLSWLFSEIDV